MNTRRVVVTGRGLLCPVGNTIKRARDNIREDRSGIRPINELDASDLPTRIAGEVNDFEVTEYLPAHDARRMDPFIHYGIAAPVDAIQDAGLEVTDRKAKVRTVKSKSFGFGGTNASLVFRALE